jgi:hypothetical protein
MEVNLSQSTADRVKTLSELYRDAEEVTINKLIAKGIAALNHEDGAALNVTDRIRIMACACALEDEFKIYQNAVTVPAWRRRFVFDDDGVLMKIQDARKDRATGKLHFRTVKEVRG